LHLNLINLQARTPFWFYKDIILRDFLFFRIVNVLVHKGLSCHVHDFFTMHLNSEVTIKPIWNCDQSHDPTLPNFTLFFLVTTAKKKKKKKPYLPERVEKYRSGTNSRIEFEI